MMQHPAADHFVDTGSKARRKRISLGAGVGAIPKHVFAHFQVDEGRRRDSFRQLAPGHVGVDDGARAVENHDLVLNRSQYRAVQGVAGGALLLEGAALVERGAQQQQWHPDDDQEQHHRQGAVRFRLRREWSGAPQRAADRQHAEQQHRGGAACDAESCRRPQQHGQWQAEHGCGGNGLDRRREQCRDTRRHQAEREHCAFDDAHELQALASFTQPAGGVHHQGHHRENRESVGERPHHGRQPEAAVHVGGEKDRRHEEAGRERRDQSAKEHQAPCRQDAVESICVRFEMCERQCAYQRRPTIQDVLDQDAHDRHVGQRHLCDEVRGQHGEQIDPPVPAGREQQGAHDQRIGQP